MGTVKGSALLDAARKRSGRTCRDCGAPNPATDTHVDPDYCPACVGKYLTRCRSCRGQFIRDGWNRLCLACRYQLDLFGDPA